LCQRYCQVPAEPCRFPDERRMITMENMACGECGNAEFLLQPDGKIICAGDDCHAPFGQWVRPEVPVRP
jgi:hypothetical protein